MSGGKSSSVTVGYRYYMSAHFGIGRGPVDELVQINVGNIRAWPVPDGDAETISGLMLIAQGPNNTGVEQYEDGTIATTTANRINTASGPDNKTISINAPNLFGGDKKEGGIQGSLNLLFGQKTQTIPDRIKSLLGGLVPAFRGVFTVFYDGLICALNPYPKEWTFRVRRVLQGWDGAVWQPGLAVIWLNKNSIKSMNGAHIIYECITNRDWGRGLPREVIKEDAWLASAQTMFNEGLGLCAIWNRQDELSNFIQDCLDHMGGSLYPDPSTGLIVLDLMRGGYDPSTVPLYTYNTGLLSISDDETSTRDDLVNEIIVDWHDPIKNEDRQIRLHNLASFQSLKALKSTTTPYKSFPVSELAARAGQRDLKINSTALKRFKLVFDRRAWKIRPGSLFRISAPDKNIANLVLRAGKIRKGTLTSGRIEVEAVLDVFGLESSSYLAEQEPVWTPPDRTAVASVQRLVRESTYADLVTRLSQADLAYVDVTSGTVVTMAGKPSSGSQNYNIASRSGVEEFASRSSATFAQTAVISSALSRYSTTVNFNNPLDIALVEIGEPIQIGNEICRLDSITINESGTGGSMTIGRGCTDTIPEPHSIGTIMYFFGSDLGSDEREYAMGEVVDVKLLTNTSTQQLLPDDAPSDTVQIKGRQGRPWSFGNFRINGAQFASTLGAEEDDDIEFTWEHRNRKLIQDILVDYSSTGSIAEEGVSYTIRIYSDINSTTPVRVVTGLIDTDWTYTTSAMDSDDVGLNPYFVFEAIRSDGMTSQFKHELIVQRA